MEWMPSAPTSTSASTRAPLANRASTRSPRSIDVDKAVPEMHAFGGNADASARQQVGPMHLVVREPERRLERLGEWRAQQRAAVIPAPLVPRQTA